MEPVLKISGLEKQFMLHTQNGSVLNVLNSLCLEVMPGEIVALCGPSGAGKSSLLKLIYGTYRASGGSVLIRHQGNLCDVTSMEPRHIIELRNYTLGYVSQFLRVIPRVSTLDIVCEPALVAGGNKVDVQQQAAELLHRLGIAHHMHHLSPLTFSGGEQQRVNIARAILAPKPVMLFDEPTASLDPKNREIVLELILKLKDQGSSIIGIFHNEADRRELGTREIMILPAGEKLHV